MLTTKDIAIVILNWNGCQLLEQFLPSVIEFSENAVIYIADNNSSDDSISYISSQFPSVKCIKLKENYGYAKGYNLALQNVKEPIYCLLNNDVEVTKNWLLPILKQFNQTNTAIIQPKLLDHKQKDHFEYAGAAGGFLDKLGYPYCRGRIFNAIEIDRGQYNDTIPIFWASGACLFIKKSVFDDLQGFDECFFAHMEEIDLCWRAYNSGFNTIYTGASRVFHLGGATLNHNNPKKTYLNFRNSLFTLVKNAHGHIMVLVIARLLLDGVAGLRFLLQIQPMHFIAILRAHFSFYKALPKLVSQRKSLVQRPNYYQKTSIVWDYFIKMRKVV